MKRYERDVFAFGHKPEGKQCKTCLWYGNGRCDFYTLANNHFSNLLDLDIRVRPTDGCTMMQEDEGVERERRLKDVEI